MTAIASSNSNLTIHRESCPVCDKKSRSVLFNANHDSPGFSEFVKFERFYGNSFQEAYNNGSIDDLDFEIAECTECRFIYLTQILNDTGMGLLYNEWLDKELLKAYYLAQKINVKDEIMLTVIKAHFRKKSKINVMDFGAGYGNFCSIATNLGLNTYAFDLSSDKNNHMNDMGVNIINNFEQFKGYFDFIYINQVFEHVANPREILSNLRKSLTNTGILYMAVPDCKDLKKILKEEGLSNNLFKLTSPHQHINSFTHGSLTLLGINAGLKPMSLLDFLALYNTSFKPNELLYLIKKGIRNSIFGTELFFNAH